MGEQLSFGFGVSEQPSTPRKDPMARRWGPEIWWLDEEAGDHVGRYLGKLARIAEAESASSSAWSQVGVSEYEQNSAERKEIQDTCHKLYFKNPFARNIINNFSFYTLGKRGVEIDWKGDKTAKTRWKQLAERNDWGVLSKDLGKLTFLCGEAFGIMFPLGEDKLKLDIRIVHPTEIEKIKSGEEDVMDIQSYTRSLTMGRKKDYYPKDVTHFKLNDIGPVKRGRPILEPAVEGMMMYDEWLHSRAALARMRSRLPIIRYVSGKTDAPPIRALPESGTVITANKNREEWKFPELHLDSGDAIKDAREMKLYIAAAVSLPYYMVSQDASNSSYASTAVVASTPLSMFKDLQGTLRTYYQDLIAKVMPAESRRLSPDVSFPEVDLRNFNEKVKSIISEFTSGLRSRRTAQLELDMDPEEEKKYLKEELMPLESSPRFRRLIESALFHAPAINEWGGNGESTLEKVIEVLGEKGFLKK